MTPIQNSWSEPWPPYRTRSNAPPPGRDALRYQLLIALALSFITIVVFATGRHPLGQLLALMTPRLWVSSLASRLASEATPQGLRVRRTNRIFLTILLALLALALVIGAILTGKVGMHGLKAALPPAAVARLSAAMVSIVTVVHATILLWISFSTPNKGQTR